MAAADGLGVAPDKRGTFDKVAAAGGSEVAGLGRVSSSPNSSLPPMLEGMLILICNQVQEPVIAKMAFPFSQSVSGIGTSE